MSADLPPARRVFLSHTSELSTFPLKWSFVAAAERAVSEARDAVTDMAYFSVRDQLASDVCREYVRQSDVLVLIAGFRYGSPVKDQPALSYCELEYLTAGEVGLSRLVFLLGGHAEGPAEMFVDPVHGPRQKAFRDGLLRSGVHVGTVTSPDDLHHKLFRALQELEPRSPGRCGPLTSDAGARSSTRAEPLPATKVVRETPEWSRDPVRVFEHPVRRDRQAEKTLRSIVPSPDGGMMVTVNEDDTARVWRADSGVPVATLPGGTSGVAFSPDGCWFVSTGERTTVERVGVADSTMQLYDRPLAGMRFSPDSRWLAASPVDGHRTDLWAVGSWTEPSMFDVPATDLGFSPDSAHLFILAETVTVWDVTTNTGVASIGPTARLSSTERMTISPDGHKVAVSNDIGRVWIFDVRTDRRITVRHRRVSPSEVLRAVFSPDGRRVVTYSAWDKSVRVWDAETGAEIGRLDHRDGVWGLVVSSTGDWLATSTVRGELQVWDTRLLRSVHAYRNRAVTCLATSADGRWLYAGTDENQVLLWADPATGPR